MFWQHLNLISNYREQERTLLSHLYLKWRRSLELYPSVSAQKSKCRRHGQKCSTLRIMAALSAQIPLWPAPCLPSRFSLLEILLQITRLWSLSQTVTFGLHGWSSAFALYFISYSPKSGDFCQISTLYVALQMTVEWADVWHLTARLERPKLMVSVVCLFFCLCLKESQSLLVYI